MLIENRCWLCQEVFQRGKTKKVFQVSSLVECFERQMEHEKQIEEENLEDMGNESVSKKMFKSRHLRECYESYQELVGSDKKNMNKLLELLKDNDIELWMSGLICGTNEHCREEMAYFIADTLKSSSTSTKVSTSTKIPGITFANKDKDCLPGCNCDNPWPFLS